MGSQKTITVKNTTTGDVVSFSARDVRKGNILNNVLTILKIIAKSGTSIEVRTQKGRVRSMLVDGVETVRQPKHRAPKTEVAAVTAENATDGMNAESGPADVA